MVELKPPCSTPPSHVLHYRHRPPSTENSSAGTTYHRMYFCQFFWVWLFSPLRPEWPQDRNHQPPDPNCRLQLAPLYSSLSLSLGTGGHCIYLISSSYCWLSVLLTMYSG